MQKLKAVWSKVSKHPKLPVVALVTAGLIAICGGAAFATKAAGDHIANQAFAKLAPDGDSSKMLDSIAQKVVDKISGKGGTLDSAQAQIVANLTGMAGKKLGKVDPSQLINDVRGQVVAAGLGKLKGISTDAIVAQVTAALIQQASTKLDSVNIDALAKAALTDVVKHMNLDKLVKDKIDSVDVQKLVSDAIAKQLGGSSGSSSNPYGNLLGTLFSSHN